MIKIYSMESCKDCVYLKLQEPDPAVYETIDIGKNVKMLKEFLVLRDSHPAFEEVRKEGRVGIPCFVKEDGSVTLVPEDMGFKSLPAETVAASFCCGPNGC